MTVEFGPGVNKNVDQRMIDGLKQCIKRDVAEGHSLTRVFISSANDSHEAPSRHAVGKAVDISRINGTRIAVGYPSSNPVKAIVDAIQEAFEGYTHRRENFGPHFTKKLGNPWTVGGHGDHIHLSVN